MGVPLNEQETGISWYRTEKGCIIYTSDSTVMTKLDKRCVDSANNYKCVHVQKDEDGNVISKQYELKDKTLISFRGRKVKRELSEDERKRMTEHLHRGA